MQIYPVILKSGDDLKSALARSADGQKTQMGCIVAATGNLSVAVLRFAGSTEPTRLQGPLNLLSLSGTVRASELRCQMAVTDSQGKVIGGELLEGCIIQTGAEVIIGLIPEPNVTPVREKEVVTSSNVAVSPKAQSNFYILHTDGASKGNPGPSGIGIALFIADDLKNPVAVVAEYIGETTNNVAEYRALIRGLREALLRGVENVEVRTDSQLMAQQVAGKYKVNAPQIVPLHNEASQLLSRFASAKVLYIPREQNSLADKLANQGVSKGR